MTTASPSRSHSLDMFPALGTLEPEQCEQLLKRNVVGRLASSLQDHVSIVPVHYVYDDGWIYGRTEAGGKLVPILRNRRVAFEVDEHQGMFSWQSVVIHGSLYLIDPDRSEKEKAAHETALRLLRGILPTTLSQADPVPFRNQFFRIQVYEMSGRFAQLGGTRVSASAQRVHDVDIDPDADVLLRSSVVSAITGVSPALAPHVHVDAFDGIVVLSGVLDTIPRRIAVERAVLALKDVKAVVQQLETMYPARRHSTDAELARDACRMLAASSADLSGVKVVVEYGWLRAEGEVSTPAIKEELIRRLAAIKGTRGVVDRVRVTDASA